MPRAEGPRPLLLRPLTVMRPGYHVRAPGICPPARGMTPLVQRFEDRRRRPCAAQAPRDLTAIGPSLSRRGFVGGAAMATGLVCRRTGSRRRQRGSDHDGHQPVALARRLRQDRQPLRAGDGQSHRARRPALCRQSREAARLGALERGSLRPAADERELVRRDVFRGLPHPDPGDRPRLQARSGDLLLGNSIYFDPVSKTMDARTGKLMSVPINPNIRSSTTVPTSTRKKA